MSWGENTSGLVCRASAKVASVAEITLGLDRSLLRPAWPQLKYVPQVGLSLTRLGLTGETLGDGLEIKAKKH